MILEIPVLNTSPQSGPAAVLDPLDVRTRTEELKLLKRGWLDGKGVAMNPTGLDWLADSFEAYEATGIPLPHLFPTPEGRVLAEWTRNRWSISLEIDLVSKRAQWHALNLDSDEENSKTVDLARADEWSWIAKQLQVPSGGGA